jgi:hypothetical protein
LTKESLVRSLLLEQVKASKFPFKIPKIFNLTTVQKQFYTASKRKYITFLQMKALANNSIFGAFK